MQLKINYRCIEALTICSNVDPGDKLLISLLITFALL